MSPSDRRLRDLAARAVESPDALFQLLVEGLDWPVPDGLELRDVELDWDPGELHLDPDKIARLRSIKQIPPLTSNQDFGVFLLDFAGGRLPIGAIRRLVDRLVRRKRGRAGSGKLPAWELDDLLFFCFSGSETKSLHVVAFRDVDGKRILRVLSWNKQTTDARLELVVQRGLPDLMWADSGPAIAAEIGTGFHGYRQGIRSAAGLSSRMADVAQDVRDEVAALYDVETADGPIRRLFSEIRDELLGDLTPERFADVYAQTMVYGLLTARIAHPEQFQADKPITALSFDNPFLDAIYARFREQSEDVVDVDELGLRELAEELATTNVDEILADFGTAQKKDDPVVFFYEDFLAKYDLQQRKDLGAFYTPLPAVRYMVRSVDEIIKSEFGLPMGVADGTTWREWADVQKGDIPAGVDPGEALVRMVDPANGTGTFFVEWLRQVQRNGGGDAVEAALGRMDALEISLASYAVAHLKVSLDLPAQLRERVRLPIYLGDTLAPPRPHVLEGMEDPLSVEGLLADKAKSDTRHNVVLGNPPYDRVSSAGTGGVVTQPNETGRSLFDDILDPAREHTIFSHHASLYNLYVYFWRWALWKAFEQREGPAVVTLITASSWLTGPGFLGLRQLARELADDIYVLDLGGDGHGTRVEENIFDIGTPVSIVTALRRGATDRTTPAVVRYRRIRGSRQEKLSALEGLAVSHTDPGWDVASTQWHAPFTPTRAGSAWEAFAPLVDLFPWQQPGLMVNRTWPIAPDAAILTRRWTSLLAAANPTERAARYVTPKTGRNINTSVGSLPPLSTLSAKAAHEPIVRYAMRSFDRQWILRDPRLIALERPALWSSVSDQQVFMTTFTTTRLGTGPGATVAAAVPDKHHFRGSFGGKDVFPLYRDAQLTPNASPDLLNALSSVHRLADSSSAPVTVERLFAYAYGLLAGADYTVRFSEELETPGPRIPLTADPNLFAEVEEHGRELIWLHTFGDRFERRAGERLPLISDVRWQAGVTRLPRDLKDVSYDGNVRQLHVADGTLLGVNPDVWAFEVSGMQVIRKWLGYRTAKGAGRAASSSSPLDAIRPSEWSQDWSDELRELVVVLTRTLELLPRGVDLLDRVVAGQLIPASDLPAVPPALRKSPRVGDAAQASFEDDDEE